MAIKKIATPLRKACRPTVKAKKETSKKTAAKKTQTKKATCAKSCCTKLAAPKKKAVAKKVSAKAKPKSAQAVVESPSPIVRASGDPERRAERIELASEKDSTISVEALKIGLLLAAIDGHCDKDEIAKFKTVAKSCGGLSPAKINQIITQTKRRISVLEDAARNGATEDEMVKNFISEASNIGIEMNCRNFVFLMSVAMVDGDYSSVERKAIIALRDRAKKSFHGFGVFKFQNKDSDVSDLFLKRCEMILAGIYKADAAGNKRLLQNRMKSLQTLVEIADA